MSSSVDSTAEAKAAAAAAADKASASASSRLEDSVPLRNAAAIFLAHFHVRKGNSLLWHKGEADLAGVEWKVLPSGSHAVERDIIYFEAPAGSNGKPRIGLAAFKNTKLAPNVVRSGIVEDEGDDDQRGARMLAVGVILECKHSSTPRSLLAATLPHISRLERLVDALSGDPLCRNLLEEWWQEHKINTSHVETMGKDESKTISQLYAHDPIFQLPAITNALGPLLPSLLKRLILPRFRLLLYVPGGAPTFQAAGIAFALGELAHAACQSDQQIGQECPASGSSMKQHGLQILGLIGLHDIARLQDEAKKKDTAHLTSWIAWTTDKILLEKCDMYDAILDLSPMTSTDGYPSNDFIATPTALPRLMSTYWSTSKTGKRTAGLRKQNWTAREFAVFRGIDEQASLNASRRGRRSPLLENTESQSSVNSCQITAPRSPYLSPTLHLSRQGGASTFLAFLRFWLANLWILPYHWRFNLRESYGYVPLSIRSDGGVQASIMLLPGDDSDEDSDEESLEEEEQDEATSSPHLSLPSAGSPLRRRRYSGMEEQAISDEEDDPILAACGATQASSRQRKSRSHSSLSKSAIENVVANHLNGSDGQMTSPSELMKAASSGQDLDEVDGDSSIVQEARESIRLSLCISEFWSLWVRELVQGGQQLIQDKLAREVDQGEGGSESFQANESEIHITASEMDDLRLSASNTIDVDLISYLASTISARPIIIQRTWWSAAVSLWS